jgi:hypothetical protein
MKMNPADSPFQRFYAARSPEFFDCWYEETQSMCKVAFAKFNDGGIIQTAERVTDEKEESK